MSRSIHARTPSSARRSDSLIAVLPSLPSWLLSLPRTARVLPTWGKDGAREDLRPDGENADRRVLLTTELGARPRPPRRDRRRDAGGPRRRPLPPGASRGP